MFIQIHIVLLATCAVFATTGRRYRDLYVGNKIISPDGFERPTVLAGFTPQTVQFPGPLIWGKKNDHFSLNVINQLKEASMLRSTAIHMHGLFMSGTPWADGGAGISQCPIAPDHSFKYRFKADNQAGTFWYHSHYATQYCDGLRGPFVVYDPHDPHLHLYDYDDESTIITLADWYHILAPLQPPIVFPNSTLINGLGRYSGGPAGPLSVIKVQPNERYRFRLVSISCDPNFVFSIDGHNLTIIEADAHNVQPYTVDSIQIHAGQRYSFVLHANQPVGNYWIRAKPHIGPNTFDDGINSAILRYHGASKQEPTSELVPSRTPMLEGRLVPLEHPGAPGSPVVGAKDVFPVHLNITPDFENMVFKVNNRTFTPPIVPVLLQLMSGAKKAEDLLSEGSYIELPPNQVIEVSMPGGDVPGIPHPMHLHGHSFDVIRVAGSQEYNFVNPVRRDVVNAGDLGDNVTIRFRTDNPGPWVLHCHVDWHFKLGLAVVFVTNTDKIKKLEPPAAWNELCPIYDALPADLH